MTSAPAPGDSLSNGLVPSGLVGDPPIVLPKSASVQTSPDFSDDSKSPVDVIRPQQRVVWDVPFDCVTLDESIDHIESLIDRGAPSYLITANLNYVMLHHHQPDIPQITKDADLIVADGQPIVWRSLLGRRKLPERVAGSQMIWELARRASQRNWGIYFLGGEPGVAEKCAKRLLRENPGMRIAGIESPPYRPLTEQEQTEQDQRIQESQAQILLVAFGQPKGERWIHQNYQRLGVPISIQLGASFDFIAGTAKRAPKIYQRIGAEWVYRMLSDPKRLAPRYWSNARFLAGALLRDWTQQVESWGMGLQNRHERRSQ